MGNKTEISLDFRHCQHCALQVVLSKYNKFNLNPSRLVASSLSSESAVTKVLITIK